ncbi:uncharacterized protein JN550_000384 [Neoarthrinium moseri]|uniref:uncharacterized protein n=1 Tax=Neoarthrinium moseri TaxID=1658444 RepID=UPI001FDB5D96|nr:uncharacterized protein JN550_000384 [Neoarthrinium moseri]KAI1878202.1 hypothetical protein JN550_000384 [Neoarthrinium moseri]
MAAQTPPKGMSSRLLTMKFMQRAAASTSSPASSPSTPKSDESSSKRRKISHATPTTTKDEQLEVQSLVDQKAIQAALEEGERKREEALVKHAAELGDARWVLNVSENTSSSGSQAQRPLQIVQVGYAQIDAPDASEDRASSDEDPLGRVQPIRRYNMGKKKGAIEANDSDDDDDSSDSDSSDASTSADEGRDSRSSQGKRDHARTSSLNSRRSAEIAKAKEFAEKRRKKEIKLNKARPQAAGGLSSISSGGGSMSMSLSSGGRPPPRQAGSFSFACHNCGETGHKAADCKRPKQRSR